MPPTRTRERGDCSQVDELTDTQHGRTQLRTLQPLSVDGVWFDHPDVVQNITKDLKSHYEHPCTCWRNAPAEHKEFWWRAFRSQYTWPEELNDKVYKSWKKKASERLRDMIFKAMKETICDWMTVDMRRRVLALKSTDEFKKKSTQNRKNKVTGPKAGTLHTSGSISASQWARRMAQKDGRRPTASEIYKQLHTRKEGSETVFCDNRSKAVWEKYEALKLSASQSGAQIEDDVLFLEAVGGVNKKGTVYGLGSESEAYYERPTSVRHSARATYAPSVLSQMEARLKKSEDELHSATASLKKSEEEVHATREELKATKEELSARIASLEALITASSSSRTPPPCT